MEPTTTSTFSNLQVFRHLEPNMWFILVGNALGVIICIIKWRSWRLRRIARESAVTADDFALNDSEGIAFDDFEEEKEEIVNVATFQHSQRPESIMIAVECTFEASNDNKDLM
jgi:hypothetical protein